ncbi:MAG: hypothetical protein WCO60_18480 [Verrucomicrobiota bacterium]
MKSPTPESAYKLAQAAEALLACPELHKEDVSDSTHQLIDDFMETSQQVARECTFPKREEILAFFKNRFEQEEKEIVVRRIVALISTFSNETLYSAYEEILETADKVQA